MIYLDYSATTPVSEEVLDSFTKCCLLFPGNPNSLHRLGSEANTLIEEATKQLASVLELSDEEVIYTSGASEANNLAIKGVALKYQNRGKHIITTELEHSSIYGPLNYLASQGFEVDTVALTDEGLVDLYHLKQLMRKDTILVSIASVNSEVGMLQPIEEIGTLLLDYETCFFHVDMTQNIGKVAIPFDLVDLASFSIHKCYGMKGIGGLIKKKKIVLEPLIHGGKSTTKYRSGTPALPLIVSTSRAIRLAYEQLDERYDQVVKINEYLTSELSTIKGVHINSNEQCIPHILNISANNIKPETLLHALEEDDIFISTQSACSSSKQISKAVYAITKNEEYAKTSVRISLSHLTTMDEAKSVVASIVKWMNRWNERSYENN